MIKFHLKIDKSLENPYEILQFPLDPKGDLTVQIQNKEFKLQKEILGKNSSYFIQLQNIKGLKKIEINENELNYECLFKVLKVLYFYKEVFSIEDLESLYKILNFLKVKELKNSFIDQLKKVCINRQKDLLPRDYLLIYNMAIENNIPLLIGVYEEIIKKKLFISNYFANYSNFINILSIKALINLLMRSYIFETNNNNSFVKNSEEIEDRFLKLVENIIEDYLKKINSGNSNELKKEIWEIFYKKISINNENKNKGKKGELTDILIEIKQIKKVNKHLNEKIEEMNKREKKNKEKIENLNEKVNNLTQTCLFFAQQFDLKIDEILKISGNNSNQNKKNIGKNSKNMKKNNNSDKKNNKEDNKEQLPKKQVFFNRNKIINEEFIKIVEKDFSFDSIFQQIFIGYYNNLNRIKELLGNKLGKKSIDILNFSLIFQGNDKKMEFLYRKFYSLKNDNSKCFLHIFELKKKQILGGFLMLNVKNLNGWTKDRNENNFKLNPINLFLFSEKIGEKDENFEFVFYENNFDLGFFPESIQIQENSSKKIYEIENLNIFAIN